MNFGETYLDVPSYEEQYDRAFQECCRADLIVVFGSSLLVPDACDLVDYVTDRSKDLIIVNKQRTPKDTNACTVIHHNCQDVLAEIDKAMHKN